MAKEFLSQRGIPFTEKDVSRDPVAAQEMMRRSHQRGVPVITIGDDVIVGFDRPRIEQALARWTDRPRPQTVRPRFGATVADAASALARRGKPAMSGAYVGAVSPDTPAARAGLRPGDVIVDLNGRRITSANDLEHALSRQSPGAQVSLTVAREGRDVRLATRL